MADVIATPLLLSAIRASLAGTAAKGTLDMNKKKETQKILDDGLLTKTETTTEKAPALKTLSKDEIQDLTIMLVEGGLTAKEAEKVAKTGFISESALKKLSKDAIQNVEGLTGVSMAFPTGDKPEGTPPVTGTTVKKQTRTETPDGVVTEKTTTFDSNAGGKKSNKTEIPEIDLSDLMSNISLIGIADANPQNPKLQEWAKQHGKDPTEVAEALKKWMRTNESLRGGPAERKINSQKNTAAVNNIHGKSAQVDNGDVMPSHMTKAEQNLVRHASQERLARQILRNEKKAKESLLHKDELE